MAATVLKFHVDGLYPSSTSPVILRGKEGEDYIVMRVLNTTTAQTRIGSMWAFTNATTTKAGDYAGDGAAGIAIVTDSIWNRGIIERTNSLSAWTKDLTVNAASQYIDVAIPLRPIVVAVEADVSETCYVGTALECGAVGRVKIFANGPVIGHSLTDKDNGNTNV